MTVMGSADAFNSAGRGHSCYALERPHGVAMVDFGCTALHRLKAQGLGTSQVRAVFFTHLHGDHIGGFPLLYIDALFHSRRTDPLVVMGPVHTEARLRELTDFVFPGVMAYPRPFSWTVTELRPGQQARWDGLTVQAFAADHMDPPDLPLCLRITDEAGAVVGFSGDTAMTDGLREAAAGADLLVAECTGLTHPCGRHCAWEDWEQEMPRLGARRLLLTHLSDAVRAEAEADRLRGPDSLDLAFAEDGMVLEFGPGASRG